MELNKEETSLLAAARRNPTAQNPMFIAVLGAIMVAGFIVELVLLPGSRTLAHTSQSSCWVGFLMVSWGHAKFARAAYSLISQARRVVSRRRRDALHPRARRIALARHTSLSAPPRLDARSANLERPGLTRTAVRHRVGPGCGIHGRDDVVPRIGIGLEVGDELGGGVVLGRRPHVAMPLIERFE